MKKKLLSLASLLALAVTLCAPVSADETRYQYDFNFPYGTFSLANFRGTLRGLHQLDVMPLRPMAKFELDPMEYTADAAAQAEYSGTGVTITSDSANEEKGDYSLKAVTDETSNRTFGRSYATLDFSVFDSVTLWERSSTTSDTYQFYVEDGSGNASYWDITSSGSAGTWVQHTLDLSSPDSNSGTAADLSDVAEYGYRQLSASNTYYFDQIYLICGMNIVVKGTDLGSYYKNVYVGNQPLEVDAQSSPAITAPSSNPRIDILTIDSAGTLAWVTGTEASSPAVPWSSVTVNKIPIALVYCKTTMTKVLAYEDKDTDTDQGYIYADVRPFVKLGVTAFTGLTDTPSSITAGQYLKGNTGGTALEFGALSQTFTGLTDTPSGYASQAGKLLAVNSGATGLEFSYTVKDEDDMASNSAAAVSTQQSLKAYVDNTAKAPTMQVFTSSGTWTRPTGCKTIIVEVVGGGGGARGINPATNSATGGGGGGGYSKKTIDVTSIASVSVTVGAAGTAGGINPSTNGGTGGTSSFGAHCSATGGAGSSGKGGGAGGVGSGGDINIKGGGGGGGYTAIHSGAGGNSVLGGGGESKYQRSNGVNGGVYGGGGSGAVNDGGGGGVYGGAGGAGVVIVTEYYSS